LRGGGLGPRQILAEFRKKGDGMIAAALLAIAFQSVPSNIPGAEACRIIRTIAADEQRRHPDQNVIRDTHFRGQEHPLEIAGFVLGRHTSCVGRCNLRAIIAWHESFQAAPLDQVLQAWTSLGRPASYTDCEVYDGEQWADIETVADLRDSERQRRLMLVELGGAEGGLSEADEPITISISRPAFDFERETALFMRNCHMVFYRRDENGTWRPLAESQLDLCAPAND